MAKLQTRSRALVLAVGAALLVGIVLIGASRLAAEPDPEPPATQAAPAPSPLLDGIPQDGAVLGQPDAPVTLVEYADLQCPYCGQAEPVVRELMTDVDLRYVWRHMPLPDVHPQAELAAEATEAAGAQGRFWEMHDLLLTRQDNLKMVDLLGYAR